MELSYQERIEAQIKQYADTIDMHDLPQIFHVWSHHYLAPGMKHVFGTASIDEAYALAYIEARRAPSNDRGRILSVGCGDGEVELRVAKILLERGLDDFTFVCADLSPILLGRLRAAVQRDGLGSYFEPVEADLNRIDVPGRFDVVLANQALHHIENLENLFDFSFDRLTDQGLFATCDMIGRNGHMRWAEAAAVLTALWPTLKPEQRYHAQLQRYSETFVDHDCSTEGFEGIRSQDVLPLMLERFHPYRFFAGGGIIDVLADRGYGHGFKVSDENDVSFIRFIAEFNDMMLDAGLLKPTWMMAYFSKTDRGETFYRDRRAINAVRNRDGDPNWTRFYTKPRKS